MSRIVARTPSLHTAKRRGAISVFLRRSTNTLPVCPLSHVALSKLTDSPFVATSLRNRARTTSRFRSSSIDAWVGPSCFLSGLPEPDVD